MHHSSILSICPKKYVHHRVKGHLGTPPCYLQLSFSLALPEHPTGTVYDLFGSLSQTTLPSVSFLKYLYSNAVPAGKLTVTDQSGLPEVYLLADNGTPLLGLQLPS